MTVTSASVLQDAATQWQQVRARLQADLGETVFRNWFSAVTLVECRPQGVILSAPTRFLRDWLLTHYIHVLTDAWQRQNPAICAIEIIVAAPGGEGTSPDTAAQNRNATSPTSASAPMRAAALEVNTVFTTAASAQPESGRGTDSPYGNGSGDEDAAAIGASLDPRFTFDNFVVGKPNELAFAAAQRVAEAQTVEFNPLFLYSGVGLGKTHLMHAIAWQIRTSQPGRRVVYLSAEKFMYQFIRALRQKEMVSFKEQFRSVDVLMVDDVQFICGKESTQEEFFHTFNALIDQNRQIVLSADKSPSDLEGLEERVRSRLGWGLVADIHATTYELRLGILQHKAERQDTPIPEKVLEFLAHRITSNVRELEGALKRLLAHATLIGRPITLESTQEVLSDLLRANDRRVTVEEIQRQVADYFRIRISDMQSSRRARTIARPRQIAMYLAKQLTSRSLQDIGRKFGGKDHTTVMYAVKRVEELIATDSSLAEDISLLRRMIES